MNWRQRFESGLGVSGPWVYVVGGLAAVGTVVTTWVFVALEIISI